MAISFLATAGFAHSTSLRIPSPDELLIKGADSITPPASITPSGVRDDVAILIYALQNAYAGHKYLPKGELQEFALARSAPMGTKEFCGQIAAAMRRLPDKHLSASVADESCSINEGQAQGLPSVGENVRRFKDRPWDLQTGRLGKKHIPTLSIAELPDHESAARKGLLDAVTKIKHEAPAIILDLRGNGGGDFSPVGSKERHDRDIHPNRTVAVQDGYRICILDLRALNRFPVHPPCDIMPL